MQTTWFIWCKKNRIIVVTCRLHSTLYVGIPNLYTSIKVYIMYNLYKFIYLVFYIYVGILWWMMDTHG